MNWQSIRWKSKLKQPLRKWKRHHMRIGLLLENPSSWEFGYKYLSCAPLRALDSARRTEDCKTSKHTYKRILLHSSLVGYYLNIQNGSSLLNLQLQLLWWMLLLHCKFRILHVTFHYLLSLFYISTHFFLIIPLSLHHFISPHTIPHSPSKLLADLNPSTKPSIAYHNSISHLCRLDPTNCSVTNLVDL